MITLLFIGFVGGLITGVSPCILPVLPVIVAGGSTSTDPKRPYFIIGGLVATFSLVVLVGTTVLSALGLPQDILTYLGVVALLLLAVGLVVPAVGEWLEKPFTRLGGRQRASEGSGFLLGASLGLVFVPCAGPVLGAISVAAARHRIGLDLVVLTVAYAVGVTIPLLVFAIVAQRTATGWKVLRSHTPMVRKVAGIVLGLAALFIFATTVLNISTPLTSVPGYASALENRVGSSASAQQQLEKVTGEHANSFAAKQNAVTTAKAAADSLPQLGPAPNFTGITAWLNTPGGKPLSLSQLRGKVVLVDFWTYSCINCERSLPHVEAWYKAYHADGLVVVGVHTPEFPFEHVVSNVAAAAQQLGVVYPIAVDNNYGTWNAYNNEYWPAEYLIDQTGQVRYTSFGEGDYQTTEQNIRTLLQAGGATKLPPATGVADRTPTVQTTPESYVGYQYQDPDFVGTPISDDRATDYRMAQNLAQNDLSFGGTWDVHAEEATAGTGAALDLNFSADDVYLVLGGTGTVTVSDNGKVRETLDVSGVPRLYTLFSSASPHTGLLSLSFTPGVQAYDFTFG